MTHEHKGCGCSEHEHENQHNCNDECGCGQAHDHDEMDVIHLEMEDGTELECYVIGVFEVNEKQYIALVPTDDDQVMLYEYQDTEEGPELINIESDEEYEEVVKAFEEAMEE